MLVTSTPAYDFGMRDIETIDSELRLIAAVRQAVREVSGGHMPAIGLANQLLDERIAHNASSAGALDKSPTGRRSLQTNG